MEKILFSCIGTTDPVRGEHDGPMLHIMRHYRPEKVCLFFTPEIYALAEKDGRFEKTACWVREHWNGYAPEIRFVRCDVNDAHDIDALDKPLHDALDSLSKAHPDAEYLINVTSGTPQMQMILSQLAMDMRYHARGIQVGNFERKSGSTARTNSRDYDIELELECNEDEQPGSENRCTEPAMYAIRREYMRQQVLTLLEQRNFDAVEQMDNALPEELLRLVRHLAARNRLCLSEAGKLANDLKGLPFKLYSYRGGDRTEYNKTCEYYLLMKNLVYTGHYTQFLLHLEPLTLQLQLALLDKLLVPQRIKTSDFISTLKNRRQLFDPGRLKNAFPALYAQYEQGLLNRGWAPEPKDISTYVCNDLLAYFQPLPAKPAALFRHYEALKELRNRLAHELCTVTDADIMAECGVGVAAILSEIEGTIIECYTACDPVIFSVYEKSIAYIRENL